MTIPSYFNEGNGLDTVSSANLDLPRHGSLAAGDWELAVCMHQDGLKPITCADGAWTKLAEQQGTTFTAAIFGRIVGTVGGNVTFNVTGGSSGTFFGGRRFIWRSGLGATTAAAYEDVSVTTGTSATATSDTTTTTGADRRLINVFCVPGSATLGTSPAGWSSPNGYSGFPGIGRLEHLGKASAGTEPAESLTLTSGSAYWVVFSLAIGDVVAPAAGISPTGIGSSGAVGAPSLALTLAPTGVASASAVGSPTLGLSLQPAGIASAAAVGSPAIGSGLALTGIASTAAVGHPSVAQMLAAIGIGSTSQAGSPTLTGGITPVGFTLTPTSRGDVTMTPTGRGTVTTTPTSRATLTLVPA